MKTVISGSYMTSYGTNSLDSCLRRINTKAFDTWPDVDDSFHTERAKSYPAIQTFSKGLKGVCPDPGVTGMASASRLQH